MKRYSNTALLAVAFSCSLLAGCSLFGPPAPPVDPVYQIIADTCKSLPLPKADNSLNIGGIEIPFKPNQPIKIGKFDFTSDQARRVSDAIYALSESRRTQCTYLLLSLKGVPPPSGERILQALDGVKASAKSSDAAVEILKTAEITPQAAVAAVEKASVEVKSGEEQTRKILSTPGASGPISEPKRIGLGDLSEEVAASIREIPGVQKILVDVQRRLNELKAAPHQLVSLDGFDSGGVALTAGQKRLLAERFSLALANSPTSRLPSVAIVGFADEPGSHLINVEIGLQRARSVALYLERNFPNQSDIHIVSSGGVISKTPSGRRVDILIS